MKRDICEFLILWLKNFILLSIMVIVPVAVFFLVPKYVFVILLFLTCSFVFSFF